MIRRKGGGLRPPPIVKLFIWTLAVIIVTHLIYSSRRVSRSRLQKGQVQRLVLSEAHRGLLDLQFPRNYQMKDLKAKYAAQHPPTNRTWDGTDPAPYYARPLTWPKEADHAMTAYRPPDLELLLRQPEIRPFELVVNTSAFPLYPEGVLVVSTAQEYRSIARKAHATFAQDLCTYIEQLPEKYHSTPFVTWVRDFHHALPFPILTKARTIGDPLAVLVPLKYDKHFVANFAELAPDPFSLREKELRVFWRGIDSGSVYHHSVDDPSYQRHLLVKRWGLHPHPAIDVAFGGGSAFMPEEHLPYYTDKVPISQQYRYRYLVSAEGNDVPTGLKWMLASNSVVLMPPPTREIWSLEGQLEPWVHYVPVREDFADLWDRVMLCEAYLDKCEAISKHATSYISFFKDHERNKRIAVERVKGFLDNVGVTLVT